MSVLVAIACAACLFGVLSGDVRVVRAVPSSRWGALALKCGALTVGAAGEEVLWRWLLLGRLSGAVGLPGAAVLSIGGFALAHGGTQGCRGVIAHLVTGSAFALLYLTTGDLLVPIVAHASYNVLVALAVEAERATSADKLAPS
jgi:membrane protease YdiL (CAAX protease family)